MLYLVTDRTLSLGRSLVDIVRSAAEGGVSMVQLREKNATSREFVELGRAVNSILKEYRIPLIINDRADIAKIIGAQGLHIGQSDISHQDARELLGADAIIGLSIENCEQAHRYTGLGLNYLAIGPIFDTSTKSDAAPTLGLDRVRELRKIISEPLVAIGGLNLQNIPAVIKAGVDSIAVVSAICSAENPKQATENLLQIINENK